MKQAPIISTLVLLFLSLALSAQTHIITPVKGQTITPNNSEITVKTRHKVDSLIIAIEYVSKSGITRKKQLGSFTKPPYTASIPVSEIPEQFAGGATVLAELYRADDTLEVVSTTNLYLQKDTLIKRDSILPKKPIALISKEDKYSGEFTLTPQKTHVLLTAKITTASTKEAQKLKSKLSFMVSIDPQISQAAHPVNSTSILHINPQRASQLITHTINKEEFAINQTQTPITIATRLRAKGAVVYAYIEIPSYLLGAAIPNQWLVNFVVQKENVALLSIYEGNLARQVAPRLMPLITIK